MSTQIIVYIKQFSDATLCKIDTVGVAYRDHETSNAHFVQIFLRAK